LSINSLKNATKLPETNAAIWFNKICRKNQLIPQYINIKIRGEKVKQSRNRPGVAQRVPGGLGSQIS
jgi:hypothetical protein